ncbi:MAG: DUF4241 domain-containing protein [Pseudomonadota bacterium]
MKAEHVKLAFAEGTVTEPSDIAMSFEVHELCSVRITSGHIVACDPLTAPGTAPFAQKVPAGEFPVRVAVANIKQDRRVAYAKVAFNEATIARWEMATVGDQNPAQLKPGELFGYGVDAGTGCFADVEAMRSLEQRYGADDEYYEVILAELEKTYIRTWGWADHRVDVDANVVMFSSGWGDGFYASYFGFAADGEVAALVTDFDVLYDPEELELDSAVGKPWWKFWG